MSPQAVVQFSGSVDCRRDGCGPLGLILSGHAAHHPRGLTHVSFAGAAPADIPPTLEDVEVTRLGDASYGIKSAARSWMLSARAVHVHREAAREFYEVVPQQPVRWTQRLFWRIVLALAASRAGRWLLGVWRRG
jgi:hypothetical protein